MDWKDTLLPGATRVSYAPGTQPADASGLGWILDLYGTPQERNDWVMGPGGKPMISGEGPNPEAGAVPSPGYFPIGSGGQPPPPATGVTPPVAGVQPAPAAEAPYAGLAQVIMAALAQQSTPQQQPFKQYLDPAQLAHLAAIARALGAKIAGGAAPGAVYPAPTTFPTAGVTGGVQFPR